MRANQFEPHTLLKSSDIVVSGWSSSNASLAPVRCSNRFSFRVTDLIEVKPDPDWPLIRGQKMHDNNIQQTSLVNP